MPLSKPVKKQQLRLPSQKQFQQLPKEVKENILGRLSVDNLIAYLEHIVCGYHLQSKNNCITLEQIVEDEINSRGDEDCALQNSLVQDWINKHANNRIQDLDSSLTEQNLISICGNESATYSEQPKSQTLDLTRAFLNNEASNFAFDYRSEQPKEQQYSDLNCFLSGRSKPATSARFRSNVWESPTSQNSRWQNSFYSENKENVSLATTESVDPIGYFNKNLSASSPSMKSVNYDYKSPRYIPAAGNSKPASHYSLATPSMKPFFGSMSSARPGPSFNPYFGEFKQPTPENNNLTPLMDFSLKDGSLVRTNINPSAALIDPGQPLASTSTDIESINLNSKDSKIFDSYQLPKPAQFNEMSFDKRALVLAKLPSNVRNKYELFCWSSQIQKASNLNTIERRLGGDITF